MKKMPEIIVLDKGCKMWEQSFEKFTAKVYVPKADPITEVVNFGFRAPYLLILEENKMTQQEAKDFANASGLAKIAASFGGSVVFIYPNNEGGWSKAPKDLFTSIIAESKISQYYKDGVALMRDRFTGNWGDCHIRGAVLRTYLYGFGQSADYIAQNCIQRIEGAGLYGPGDISPVACILENLSVIPRPQVRDIPVLSIANSDEINKVLQESVDHLLIKKTADYQADFKNFLDHYRRMVGNLESEDDLEAMGMVMEPNYWEVKTSLDNLGDDCDTKKHKIGYVAYYNKSILAENKKVALVMCFHGGGDSAMCMSSVSGWYKVAAKYNFLLVCVENHMNSTASEAVELIEHLQQKYPVDPSRIYATGFSMGGCKSWDLFQEYPKVFAGVAPMDATFEVGQNVFAQDVRPYNQKTILPVFYVGGEITPLPELPFQATKCVDRMAYVLRINKAKAQYSVKYENQENWENKIWGINGDFEYKLTNTERENSVLTLQLFESENGCCYCIFGSVSNQGHEVRHHSCENAWKFLSQFTRLDNGELEGGKMEEIKKLYQE